MDNSTRLSLYENFTSSSTRRGLGPLEGLGIPTYREKAFTAQRDWRHAPWATKAQQTSLCGELVDATFRYNGGQAFGAVEGLLELAHPRISRKALTTALRAERTSKFSGFGVKMIPLGLVTTLFSGLCIALRWCFSRTPVVCPSASDQQTLIASINVGA